MLMLVAVGILLSGLLLMLWRMFATHLLWGLAGIAFGMLPVLAFILLHWEQARRPLAYLLAGLTLGMLAAAAGSHPDALAGQRAVEKQAAGPAMDGRSDRSSV